MKLKATRLIIIKQLEIDTNSENRDASTTKSNQFVKIFLPAIKYLDLDPVWFNLKIHSIQQQILQINNHSFLKLC